MSNDEVVDSERLAKLRVRINESIRVQVGGGEQIDYEDPSTALVDISARQNHVIFGRRGSGKTLLLHQGVAQLGKEIRYVYLNCEDYKRHSFPNVLIEVLDSVFEEMERHFGGWFGKKKKAKKLLQAIRSQLAALKHIEDERTTKVSETSTEDAESKVSLSLAAKAINIGVEEKESDKKQLELEYKIHYSKVQQLDLLLPRMKIQLRDMFAASNRVKAIFVLLDDYYFLQPQDQPFVMDYVHRLCKDTPLFFKITTLRHASTLYVENKGQPTGAQERHDYQPLNIEFGVHDLKKTQQFIQKIFHAYGKLAGISTREIDRLFMGDGFSRLVLAGGGVPRDCLSLFLDALSVATFPIGKDAIRDLCRANWERRIQELKQDAHLDEQPLLLRGIYAIRQFCMFDKKLAYFVVEERELQENQRFKALLDRLLDYRLIHELGTAFTHKSTEGTFRGYIIDVGAYAGLRKLQGKLTELDLTSDEWREKIRSGPVLQRAQILKLWQDAPSNIEVMLLTQEDDEKVLELPAGPP
jgi:hypothetical protein